jgi:hypothetical protein
MAASRKVCERLFHNTVAVHRSLEGKNHDIGVVSKNSSSQQPSIDSSSHVSKAFTQIFYTVACYAYYNHLYEIAYNSCQYLDEEKQQKQKNMILIFSLIGLGDVSTSMRLLVREKSIKFSHNMIRTESVKCLNNFTKADLKVTLSMF